MAVLMGDDQRSAARLSVPAEPSSLRLARLTAASLAADLDWTVDDIDDLRVAVDELTAALIAGAADGLLELEFTHHGDGLVIEGSCAADGPIGRVDTLALELLALTTDTFSIDGADGHRRFRIEKAPSGPSERETSGPSGPSERETSGPDDA